ncbi:MAG: transcriptional regulator [Candidatus Micrarchaeota archaeon]|nr:transcriptional regulator [Candidatus Micrarchaeota archaeon]MDE1848181.1 transcriptional regulator [Candidatus Micrarchaeota archaeon]MDE1864662.1 transcriptional regulator [Candidatus Micrarchaeota archaeon]
MVELNDIEKMMYKTLSELGATKPEVLKTADDVMKKSNRPKSMVTNALTSLANKGVIKRVAREKASGYYIVQAI